MKNVIIISCFNWYDKRLKYIKQYYEDMNCNVKIVLSDFDHISKKKIADSKRISGCTYLKAKEYKKNISLKRIFSHINFSKEVKHLINTESPNVVYCLVPPNSLVKVLCKLKKKKNYNLIFDIIDLWPESMPMDIFSNSYFYKKWKLLRNGYINDADFINIECNYYKKELLNVVDESKIHTLYIAKESKNNNFCPANINEYDKEYIDVCYLGSINSIIDINEIVRVLKKISHIKPVRIKIIGDGENKDFFIESLTKADILTDYYGSIYDWDKIEEAFRTCYFGINIYKNNLSVGITIKSIDYFQLGLPIINSIKGDTEEFVLKNDIGININDWDMDKVLYFINNIVEEKKRINTFFHITFSANTVKERLQWLNESI